MSCRSPAGRHGRDRTRRALPTLLGAAVALAPQPLAAQDPWPVLDRASTAYAVLQTLTADFVQVIEHPMLGAPDTTVGRLYLRRPNRFAMRFSDPAGDRVVADGRVLWLYTPSTTPQQVIRTRIPPAGGTTPNLIGQFVERPRERYRARWLREDTLATGPADVVALEPTDPAAPYREATIWVSRTDALVQRVAIVEPSGQRRLLTLRDVRTNVDIPARELSFAPPAGTRIVDQ